MSCGDKFKSITFTSTGDQGFRVMFSLRPPLISDMEKSDMAILEAVDGAVSFNVNI